MGERKENNQKKTWATDKHTQHNSLEICFFKIQKKREKNILCASNCISATIRNQYIKSKRIDL